MQFVISLIIRMLGAEAIEAKILAKLAAKSPKFAKVLKGAKKLKDLHKSFKRVMNYIDPNYLLSELLNLPKNQIAKYLKFKKDDFLKILKNHKIDEKNLQGDLKSLKNSFKESYDNYMNGVTDNKDNQSWVKMSSSWIQRGLYNRISNTNNGIMTIFIRSDKDKKKRLYGPYIYPLIPIEVWTAMVRAKGKNGTGAGTVFWRMWLRKWLKSYLRDHTYKKLQAKYGTLNSQTYKRLPNINQISQLIREQQELVKKAQYGYYKTRTAQMAYQGYDHARGSTKPFSPIDNPTYIQNRKLLQKEQYDNLRQPINNTISKLQGVRKNIIATRVKLKKARQSIRDFNNIKNSINNVKQFIKDPIKYNVKQSVNAYKSQTKKRKKGE